MLGKPSSSRGFTSRVEKYVKQIVIEAETMVSMARGLILPAALEHQRRMAEAVAATKAAGVDAGDTVAALREFVELVTGSAADGEVERLAAHHEADPMKHAAQIAASSSPRWSAARGGGRDREHDGGRPVADADVPGVAVPEVARRGGIRFVTLNNAKGA